MTLLNKVLNQSMERKQIKQLAPKPADIISNDAIYNRYLLIMITLLCYLKSILLSSYLILIKNPEFLELSISIIQASQLAWGFLILLILIIIAYNANTINLLTLIGASNNFIIKRVIFSFAKIGILAGLVGSFMGLLTILVMYPFLRQISILFSDNISNDFSYDTLILNDFAVFLLIPIFCFLICIISSYLTVRKIIKNY